MFVENQPQTNPVAYHSRFSNNVISNPPLLQQEKYDVVFFMVLFQERNKINCLFQENHPNKQTLLHTIRGSQQGCITSTKKTIVKEFRGEYSTEYFA